MANSETLLNDDLTVEIGQTFTWDPVEDNKLYIKYFDARDDPEGNPIELYL